MNWRKWFIRVLLTLIFVIVAAAVFLELNKGRIISILTREVNKNINGAFEHQGGTISILTTFPFVNLSLWDVELRDTSDSSFPPLFTADRLALCLDLRKVLSDKGLVRIREFSADRPNIHIWQGSHGQSNYDIFKENPDTTTRSPVDLDIQYYHINEMSLEYHSDTGGLHIGLKDYNLLGDLQYMDERIIMTNRLSGKLSVLMESLGSSVNYATNGEIAFNVLQDGSEMTIERANVTINDFPVYIAGKATRDEPYYSYDFSLTSANTGIKQFLSLLPLIYANEYDSMVAGGTFEIQGYLNGSTRFEYPLYEFSLVINDGSMKYPDLPGMIEGIVLDFKVVNDNTSLPYTDLDLSEFRLSMGQNRLYGSGKLSNAPGVTRTTVSSNFNIVLDDLKRTLYLPEFTAIQGSTEGEVTLDALFRPSQEKWLLKEVNALQIKARGDSIRVVSTNGESFHLEKGSFQSAGRQLDFTLDRLNYNDIYKFDASGSLYRFPEGLLSDDPIAGKVNLKASMLDLRLLSDTSGESRLWVIPQLRMDMDASIDTILYPGYDISGLRLSGQLTNEQATLDYSLHNFAGSTLRGKAHLTGVMDYALNNAVLGGNIRVQEASIDLNKLVESVAYPQGYVPPKALVPSNIALEVEVGNAAIKYGKVDIQSVTGDILIRESVVTFQNRARLLGGAINLSGEFDGNDRNSTSVDFNLDLGGLLFSETARKLDFFTVLVPVSDYLEGQYSSTLKWYSKLDEAYFPVLSTLTSFGVLETSNGRLKGFLPVDTLMNFLGAPNTNRVWEFAATQNWFNIENGRVKIEETQLQKGDIRMSFSGTHSFSHDLDYLVSVNLPKRLLKLKDMANLPTERVPFLDQLKSFAADREVQVVVSLTGKPNRPKFKIADLRLAEDGQGESLSDYVGTAIKQQREIIEQTVRDTVVVLRDKLDSKVESVKDSLRNMADKEKKEVVAQGKDLLDSLKAGRTDSLLIKGSKILTEKKKSIEDLKKIFGKDKAKKKQDGG